MASVAGTNAFNRVRPANHASHGAGAADRGDIAGAGCSGSLRADDHGHLEPTLEADIRRAFFQNAALAARHRVSCDEVLAHLVRAGLAMAPRPQRAVSYLGDVIIAVACVRGEATAWNDVLNAHAWCLDRACAEGLGPTTGLPYARRFWTDLRMSTANRADHLPDERRRTRLQTYAGLRPLRLWLADRLLGGMAAAVWGRAWGVLDSPARSSTLPNQPTATADAGASAT